MRQLAENYHRMRKEHGETHSDTLVARRSYDDVEEALTEVFCAATEIFCNLCDRCASPEQNNICKRRAYFMSDMIAATQWDITDENYSQKVEAAENGELRIENGELAAAATTRPREILNS